MSSEMIELLAGIALGFIPFVIYLIAKEYPPKNINSFYGYRTNRSMKNEDTWQEANIYANRLFIPVGILTIIIAIICYAYSSRQIVAITGFSLAILSIAVLGITEWHLHKTFDKHGHRKQ